MNVLLIRLRLIGDVVFTTPAIRAIKRALPHTHLTYLVESGAAPIVAGNPHLDRAVVVAHRRGLARLADDLALAHRLRALRFDAVLDFHGGPRSAWLTRASGAARRIGYRIPGRTWAYTTVVERPRELRPRHSVENQWDLLPALLPGLPPPSRNADPVEMAPDAAAEARVRERLRAAAVSETDPLIVVHVSAGNPFRRWPAANFVDLVAALSSAAPNRRIILTSGPSETGAAGAIAREAVNRLPPGRRRAVLNLSDPDLYELRSLIARASLFIGGDSGPLHVAATTETPIVALFGPTLAERSAPWRAAALVTECVDVGSLPCRPCDQRRCAPGDFRCLAGLEPARVHAAAERALGSGSARRNGRDPAS